MTVPARAPRHEGAGVARLPGPGGPGYEQSCPARPDVPAAPARPGRLVPGGGHKRRRRRSVRAPRPAPPSRLSLRMRSGRGGDGDGDAGRALGARRSAGGPLPAGGPRSPWRPPRLLAAAPCGGPSCGRLASRGTPGLRRCGWAGPGWGLPRARGLHCPLRSERGVSASCPRCTRPPPSPLLRPCPMMRDPGNAPLLPSARGGPAPG